MRELFGSSKPQARWRLFLLLGLLDASTACRGTTMTPTGNSLNGQWIGTTAQGQPIALTVSGDELVTAITLGHSFNGCTGSETFSNLSLQTRTQSTCIPAPCPSSITDFRQFAATFGNPVAGPSTELHGLFPVGGQAQGTANFRSFERCGSAIGVAWTAAKK